MINNLRIQNFKSWQDTGEMKFSKITGFFGPNSSGKTSILQLLMLKQTAESSDRSQVLNFGDTATPVNLGTFRDTVYHKSDDNMTNGQTSEDTPSLSWSIGWDLPKPLRVANSESKGAILFSPRSLEFFGSVRETGNRSTRHLVSQDFQYRFEYEGKSYTLGMERTRLERNDYELIHQNVDLRRTQGRPWPLPLPIKCYGFPSQSVGYYQNAEFLPDFNLAFEELSGQIFYLGPLREYPQRQYVWSGGQPSDMGRRGERVIDALLSSRERKEKIARGKGRPQVTVEEYVALWLRDLGLIHSFVVEAIAENSNLYQVRVKKTAASPSVLITDVGFGVSQVLPVLTLCFYVPKGSTIILEQPEIHLHPLVQAGLADVFVDAIKKRDIQIILESHSEHLLTRLQRRIAEEEITSEDASLYFCERGKSSTSKLLPLEMDIFGNIKNWPKDFFGDEFSERSAMIQAGIRRKQRQATK
ncbi:MAG: DUF3696 domain-containing protein [Janthinobacterium lividum]